MQKNTTNNLSNDKESILNILNSFGEQIVPEGKTWRDYPDRISDYIYEKKDGRYAYTLPIELFIKLDDIKEIIKKFIDVSKNETFCQKIDTKQKPLIVVGDIHGSMDILIHLIKKYGIDDVNYLFLGDYIDRYSCSLECLVIVYLLKIYNPNNILLRGNHEIEIGRMELRDSIKFRYKYINEWEEIHCLVNMFKESFDYLTMCSIVDDKYFCVHAGIPSQYKQLICSDINKQKPFLINVAMDDYNKEMSVDQNCYLQMLWNDPQSEDDNSNSCFMDENEDFKWNNVRKCFYKYSTKAVNDFLSSNGFKFLIRGHQVVDDGIQFKDNIITVHTVNYEDGKKNGYLIIFHEEIKPMYIGED